MAKPVRVTIEFDDGTSHVIDTATAGSIYLTEGKARDAGKSWRKSETGGPAATTQTGECYWVNGVIVCP